MTVRLATREDEDEFIKICLSIHQENGIFPVSARKLRDLWEKYIYAKGGVLGVIGEVGKLEGAAYLTIGSVYYSEQPILDELFVHVLPQYRASNNAKELLEWCKTTADELNFPLLVGVVSTEQTEAKIRLMRRRLGNPVGAFFKYEPRKVA
jgi:hypothetical protein